MRTIETHVLKTDDISGDDATAIHQMLTGKVVSFDFSVTQERLHEDAVTQLKLKKANKVIGDFIQKAKGKIS